MVQLLGHFLLRAVMLCRLTKQSTHTSHFSSYPNNWSASSASTSTESVGKQHRSIYIDIFFSLGKARRKLSGTCAEVEHEEFCVEGGARNVAPASLRLDCGTTENMSNEHLLCVPCAIVQALYNSVNVCCLSANMCKVICSRIQPVVVKTKKILI